MLAVCANIGVILGGKRKDPSRCFTIMFIRLGVGMSNLVFFVAALAAVYVVPGADMILVLRTAAVDGRAAALGVAIGLGLARAVHVTLAAVGLATLLAVSPLAFDLLCLMGAIYLVWLGVSIWRENPMLPNLAAPDAPVALSKRASLFMKARQGFVTNLANPKALLFCSVLLPQFIDADRGSVGGQFFLLGSILVLLGLAFDGAYALAGGVLGRVMAHSRAFQLGQRLVFSGLLIGFGLELALSTQLV